MHPQILSSQILGCPDIFSNLPQTNSTVLILVGTSIILLILWVVRYTYIAGYPDTIKLVSLIYQQIYRVWPAFIFIHTTWVIASASIISFIIFLPFTDKLIVNITAVYATILFLEGSLRKKVPLLDVSFQDNPPWSMETDTDLIDDPDSQYVVKQKITVENFGDDTADNINVMCRAICPGKGITREWKRVTFGNDDAPVIGPNEEKETELVLDTFDDYSGQEYLTEVKAKPNVRQGHLAIRTFHHPVPRQPESN